MTTRLAVSTERLYEIAERVRKAGSLDNAVSYLRATLGVPGLDETALAAAEHAYWHDDGVSRHNLGAAILVYLSAVRQ